MTSAPRPEHSEPRPGADDPAAPGREAEEAAGSGSEADEVTHDLDALLEDVKRERDEYLGLAQRAKADFENYRKRATREAADAEQRGKASLARALLPSIDNLERALVMAGVDPGANPGVAAESEEVSAQEALARGVALIHSELQGTLARAGVEAYDPAGERFDPTSCEAISTRPPSEGVEPGTVVETLERGYRLDGQILRPARVIVSD